MVDTGTPRVLWAGASYNRICREWEPTRPIEIIPEVELSVEAYKLHPNIKVLADQAIYSSDPQDEDYWLVALDPSQEGLATFSDLTDSGEISTVVIEGCLVSGLKKAPMVNEQLRSNALVILLNNTAAEQQPYRALGYQHFCIRSNPMRINESLRSLGSRIYAL